MNETAPLKVVPGAGGLHATALGKRYKKRPVVRNVSLSLQRGEAVGLLGPNGAGKTTTFYMITGLVQPDEGRVMMDGHDVTMLPMYRRARLGLGYLPQEASIFRGLTVEQNIRAALEVVEPEADRRAAMLDELLAEFGIAHLRRAPALALCPWSGRARMLVALRSSSVVTRRSWPDGVRGRCDTRPLPSLTAAAAARCALYRCSAEAMATSCDASMA